MNPNFWLAVLSTGVGVGRPVASCCFRHWKTVDRDPFSWLENSDGANTLIGEWCWYLYRRCAAASRRTISLAPGDWVKETCPKCVWCVGSLASAVCRNGHLKAVSRGGFLKRPNLNGAVSVELVTIILYANVLGWTEMAHPCLFSAK